MTTSDAQECVTKVCTKCGEKKALDEFYKAKDRPLGVQSQCKQCKKEWYLDDYKNNPDKYAKRGKQWRDNNRDTVMMIRKEYERTSPVRKAYLAREDVKQRRREIVSAFHVRNPEAREEYSRNYRQRHADGRFAIYKKKYREDLGVGYVKETILQKGPRFEVPGDLIDLKREKIKISRAIKQQKQLLKEVSNAK